MFQRISRQIRPLSPREPVRPAVDAQRRARLDTTVYIDGMHGIGDNINQRCFVKTLARQGKTVFIKTPLPEIYHDIPGVRFVRADTSLRTQKKNVQRTQATFVAPPRWATVKKIFYGNRHMQQGSIFDAMTAQFGVPPAPLDLPRFTLPALGLPAGKPVALIRPTTERKEWHNATRGPLNRYVDRAARVLAQQGYHVVSVADLLAGEEWIVGTAPFAQRTVWSPASG